jgi:hypothetical protein
MRRSGCVVAMVVAIAAVLILPFWTLASAGLNFLTGEYGYDPRTSTPIPWLIATRPEQSIAAYVQDQIVRTGTFPVGAPAGVQSVEAVAVRANVYTDSQTPAEVALQLRYSNTSTAELRFHFYSTVSKGLELGSFALSYDAHFPSQVNRCFSTGPTDFECTF